LFVVLVTIAPVVATCFALWNEQRYYFVLVPLLCIWAANGFWEVGLWTKASSEAAGWNWLGTPIVSQGIVPGMLALAMILGTVSPVRRIYVFLDSARPTRVDKAVGEWIARQQNNPVRIMDLSIPLAFHADAQFSYFPYCTSDSALRYLDAAGVDYVVLRRGEKFTKYYEEWLNHGIPDHRAELLRLPALTGVDKFVIFRWHGRELATSSETGQM
jgi:hypothetical protein